MSEINKQTLEREFRLNVRQLPVRLPSGRNVHSDTLIRLPSGEWVMREGIWQLDIPLDIVAELLLPCHQFALANYHELAMHTSPEFKAWWPLTGEIFVPGMDNDRPFVRMLANSPERAQVLADVTGEVTRGDYNRS